MRILIVWIPRLLALLCILAAFPWLLGVPGVDNTYALGWTIGLFSLVFYVLAHFFIAGAGLVSRSPAGNATPATWKDKLHWLAVGAFVIAQATAWPLILSS